MATIKEFGGFSNEPLSWITSKLNACDPGWVVTDVKIVDVEFFEPEGLNFYCGIIEYTKESE